MFSGLVVGCCWASQMTLCLGSWIPLHSLTSGEFRSPNWESFRGTQLRLCSSKDGIARVLPHAPGLASIRAPSRKCSVSLDFQEIVLIRTQEGTSGSAALVPCSPQDKVSCNPSPKLWCPFHGPEEAFPVTLPTAPFSCGPLFIFPLHSASWTFAPMHFPPPTPGLFSS